MLTEYYVTFALAGETFTYTVEARNYRAARRIARDRLWERHRSGELTLLDYDRCRVQSIRSKPTPDPRRAKAGSAA